MTDCRPRGWSGRTWCAPPGERPEMFASILGFIGLALALVGGWLGGELVERLGVGVDEGANLDAPNSLTTSTHEMHKNAVRG